MPRPAISEILQIKEGLGIGAMPHRVGRGLRKLAEEDAIDRAFKLVPPELPTGQELGMAVEPGALEKADLEDALLSTPTTVSAQESDSRTRAERRRIARVHGEKGKIARVGLKYGAKLVATRDVPTGTAVKLDLKGRMVPLMPGQERDSIETEPIKRSSRTGSKPRRTILEREAERKAAEYGVGKSAAAEISDLFGEGYVAGEDEAPEAPDPITVFREQSLGVAGDAVVTGDELVDKIKRGSRTIVVSLDELRKTEIEAEAQELFDYGTTAVDLRDFRQSGE
jgi:hypothetical protein